MTNIMKSVHNFRVLAYHLKLHSNPNTDTKFTKKLSFLFI